MDSELVLLLKETREDLERKITSYVEENAKITDLEHVQTREDEKRRKELVKLLEEAKSKLKQVKEKLSTVLDLEDEIEELKEELSSITNKNTRRAQRKQEKLDTKLEDYEKLKKELEAIYKLGIKDLEKQPTSKKEINKSKIGVYALLIAIGMVLGKCTTFSAGTSNNKNNGNNPEPAPSSNSAEFTQENPNDIEQGVTLVEENGELFVDIFDEEQVALRGQEILPYFEELAPNLKFTNNNAEKLLNCMNCGLVKEINQAQGLEQVNIFEALLNGEINYSIDLVNKGFSLRKEQNTVVDYGKFFIDGSKTQELASEMSEYRYGMMIDKENGKEYATKFTVLLMKSWLLDGCDNEVISAYRLESSSNKVFIDKLFLNTAMLAGAYDNIEVINPLDGEVITLKYLIEEINKNNCPVELIADNGDIVNTYTNKFSYDMIGMISELTYNNENKNVRSLTK